jgi:DNA-binding transcriptional MerR regulator
MELKEKIETLKAKGMTIREIKEILNISNRDIYDNIEEPKPDAGLHTTTEEEESPGQGNTKPSRKEAKPDIQISDKFATIKISSNRAVNDLTRHQERCIEELIAIIDKPFKDQWEWQEWQREAIALQLSQHTTNEFFMENMAIWDNLIEGHATREKRNWVVFLMTNFLVKTFAQARAELQYSERDKSDKE